MLKTSEAAELLKNADRLERLPAIGCAFGFERRAHELTRELQSELAVPANVRRAWVARGQGALRCLYVELDGQASTRQCVVKLAASLARNAPYSIWLIVGCVPSGAHTFVAAWTVRDGRALVRSMLCDRHHALATDAETICSLAAVAQTVDVLTHARWLEILGRDALTQRFYRSLRDSVERVAAELGPAIPSRARREIALINTSRLLFLCFLQTRGLLDGDHEFLLNSLQRAGERFHTRVLEPLFFGTLNTRTAARAKRAREFGQVPYLNGGLFSRAYVERRYRCAKISDDSLGALFDNVLARYRFTPREDAESWSETAIDPEILGRAFESLMDPRARKSSGAYYTPAEVVRRATHVALLHALARTGDETDVEAALNDKPLAAETANAIAQRTARLRVLDPACGSGAFLVHVLAVLATLRSRYGDESLAVAKRAVLSTCIYGIDIDATAVWLCQLRLWLSLAVEPGDDLPPLPNLDRSIRVGDTLAAGDFAPITGGARCTEAGRLRARYARAHGVRKRTLARALDRLERSAAIASVRARISHLQDRRRSVIAAARSRDLFGERTQTRATTSELREIRDSLRGARAQHEALRGGAALPFSFATYYADIAGAGGFDLVIGNPPWVRPHNAPAAQRRLLRARFDVLRAGAWAPAAGSRIAFGHQVDLSALFVEQSLRACAPGGVTALLIPSKLWRSLAGSSMRAHLLRQSRMLAIDDFTNAHGFDAAVYPSLFVARRNRRGTSTPASPITVTIHRRESSIAWSTDAAALSLDDTTSAPWILAPSRVRRAFDSIRERGTPLSHTRLGVPRLGVKTALNDAYLVEILECDGSLASVRSGEHTGWIEARHLRPVLRGAEIRRWRSPPNSGAAIVWTHDALGKPARELAPHTRRWLGRWRHALASRVDARTSARWWELFRTAAADNRAHRVVWSDIGRRVHASVIDPGDTVVPLNTCYVLFANGSHAWALAALLNSALTTAWLNAIAEPARGGYNRYLGWTMSLLPVPALAALGELGEIGLRAARGEDVSDEELTSAAERAYGLTRTQVSALLEWVDV